MFDKRRYGMSHQQFSIMIVDKSYYKQERWTITGTGKGDMRCSLLYAGNCWVFSQVNIFKWSSSLFPNSPVRNARTTVRAPSAMSGSSRTRFMKSRVRLTELNSTKQAWGNYDAVYSKKYSVALSPVSQFSRGQCPVASSPAPPSGTRVSWSGPPPRCPGLPGRGCRSPASASRG